MTICYCPDLSTTTVPWGILARLLFVVIHRVLQLSRAIDCFSPLEACHLLLILWELVPRKMVSRSPPPQPPCVEGLVVSLWLCCGAVGLEPFIFCLLSTGMRRTLFHCVLPTTVYCFTMSPKAAFAKISETVCLNNSCLPDYHDHLSYILRMMES